jgi:hypothetical protein
MRSETVLSSYIAGRPNAKSGLLHQALGDPPAQLALILVDHRCRANPPGNCTNERRLADAIRTEQREQLSFAERERQAVRVRSSILLEILVVRLRQNLETALLFELRALILLAQLKGLLLLQLVIVPQARC